MLEYSPAFHAALQHVLEFEGGWSDHPEDPGGKTYKGITLALYRKWRNNDSVPASELKAIKPEEVYEIYHTMFWRAVRGDQLPPAVAAMAFDAAVNSGPKNAIAALQNAVAKLSKIAVEVDGVMGPETLKATNAVDTRELTYKFAARRMVFYGLLKTFRMFGFGWADRLMAGLALAQQLIAAGNAVSKALKETNDGT